MADHDSIPDPMPLIRLPGKAARLRLDGSPGGSLWLAPHHLLQVRSGVLREGYRRFAYRDIQSINVRRTVRGFFYNLVLGGTGVLFGIILVSMGLTSAPSRGGMVLVGGIAGVGLVLTLVNTLRGATVRCDLRTAVGLYPLSTLSRMGPAQRSLELLTQRVEAAQGALSAEVLAEFVGRLTPRPAATPAVPTGATPTPTAT